MLFLPTSMPAQRSTTAAIMVVLLCAGESRCLSIRDCSTGLVSTIREYLYIGRISFCYGAEAPSIHSDHALPHIQLTSKLAHAQTFSCSGVASHAAVMFLLRSLILGPPRQRQLCRMSIKRPFPLK